MIQKGFYTREPRYSSTSEIPYGQGSMNVERFLRSQRRTIEVMFRNGFRSKGHETFAAPWTITDIDHMFDPLPVSFRDLLFIFYCYL